jgi:hypothetical protein
MEDCRIARQVAEWNPQGKRRCSRSVNVWKDGIRALCKEKISEIKNVSIESSRGKSYVFGLRKTVYSQKNTFNNRSK